MGNCRTSTNITIITPNGLLELCLLAAHPQKSCRLRPTATELAHDCPQIQSSTEMGHMWVHALLSSFLMMLWEICDNSFFT